VAIFENKIGFHTPLEPDDLTDAVIDELHSGALEESILYDALRNPAPSKQPYDIGQEYLDDRTDEARAQQELFDEIMK